MLQQQIRDDGRKPGRGNICRRCFIDLLKFCQEGLGLFLGAQLHSRFPVAPEHTLQAAGIHRNTHQLTFSFTTTLTKSLGTSR